jgi:hypothetical protein
MAELEFRPQCGNDHGQEKAFFAMVKETDLLASKTALIC